LFSEFDLNPNDFQYFDHSTNTITYPQQSLQAPLDLPPSYDTALLSTTTTTDEMTPDPTIQIISPVIDEYISSNTLKSLIEQHQAHQSIVKYSSSPPPSVPTHQTIYSESSSILSVGVSEHQPNKVTSGRKSTSKRSRPPPPVHLPKLIKKPEPIPVTLDQFQAV